MKLKWLALTVSLLLPVWVAATESVQPLTKNAAVDGYSISYYMERVDDDTHSAGTYHLVARIEKDGKAAQLLKAVAKVITSDGQALMQKMKQNGASYVSSFKLEELGQNQIMIQFRTMDKKNHFIGGWYPGMDQGAKR